MEDDEESSSSDESSGLESEVEEVRARGDQSSAAMVFCLLFVCGLFIMGAWMRYG